MTIQDLIGWLFTLVAAAGALYAMYAAWIKPDMLREWLDEYFNDSWATASPEANFWLSRILITIMFLAFFVLLPLLALSRTVF